MSSRDVVVGLKFARESVRCGPGLFVLYDGSALHVPVLYLDLNSPLGGSIENLLYNSYMSNYTSFNESKVQILFSTK